MYAADPRMRINLGIRRRLAPLMENDAERIKLMNSLLLSMPGSPILYYGDEIGMGDNIYLGDRNGVRTPMQWSPDRNAGFSRADPQRLYLPPIMDPIYGYEAVNVEAQARDPSSLLNWTRRMLAVRKTSQAFGRGTLDVPATGQPQDPRLPARATATRRSCASPTSRARRSRSSSTCALQGPRAGRAARPHAVPADRRAAVPADAAGARLLLVPARDRRAAAGLARRAARATKPPVLVLFDGWPASSATAWCRGASAWREKLRAQLETRCCRATSRRSAGTPPRASRSRGARSPISAWRRRAAAGCRLFDVQTPARAGATSCRSRSRGKTRRGALEALAAARVASVRQQANVGVFADALADERFGRALVDARSARREHPSAERQLRFTPTRAFAALRGDESGALTAAALSAEQQHHVRLGERLFLKGYRRLRPA